MASELFLSTLVLIGLGVNLIGSVTIVSPNLPYLQSAGLVVQSYLRGLVPWMRTDYRRLKSGFEKVKGGGLEGGGETTENEQFTEVIAYLGSPEMVEQAGIPLFEGEDDVTDIGRLLDIIHFQELARAMQEMGGRVEKSVDGEHIVMTLGGGDEDQVTRELNYRQVKSQLDIDIRQGFLTAGIITLFVGFSLQAASEFLSHGISFYLQGVP